MKNILVIGSGGREHAICKQFKNSSQESKIYALPGNAGISQIAEIINTIKVNEHQKIADFCKENSIDFVFIGPEQPLVEGIVDYLEKNNIRVFGPSKAASQLEGSKSFMKKIVVDSNVATAIYETFYESKEAIEFGKKLGFPCVIKTDGLAAGKGVIIVENEQELEENIREVFEGKFGKAGNKIIIEEFLTGYEASYFVICDGKNFVPLGFAHDHKRVGENDTGLNTGGMGTYAPSPIVDKDLEKKVIEEIIKPSLKGMEDAGCPFVGILFAGLMINKNNQPKLLEYNIRFGDPETQIILPRIKSDFIDVIEHAVDKKLDQIKVEFDEESKYVCVVMCTKGYPGSYEKGSQINNLEEAQSDLAVDILHAGTALKNGKIIATGGRVLNIIAKANDFETAREKAYESVDKIDWPEGFVRRDIAKKAL